LGDLELAEIKGLDADRVDRPGGRESLRAHVELAGRHERHEAARAAHARPARQAGGVVRLAQVVEARERRVQPALARRQAVRGLPVSRQNFERGAEFVAGLLPLLRLDETLTLIHMPRVAPRLRFGARVGERDQDAVAAPADEFRRRLPLAFSFVDIKEVHPEVERARNLAVAARLAFGARHGAAVSVLDPERGVGVRAKGQQRDEEIGSAEPAVQPASAAELLDRGGGPEGSDQAGGARSQAPAQEFSAGWTGLDHPLILRR
jgi:hypothetical protein